MISMQPQAEHGDLLALASSTVCVKRTRTYLGSSRVAKSRTVERGNNIW